MLNCMIYYRYMEEVKELEMMNTEGNVRLLVETMIMDEGMLL